MDCLHLEWEYILEFAGQEHRGYSGDVEVIDFLNAWAILEVAVHERDREEESLVVASEISEDLDHPVDHPSS